MLEIESSPVASCSLEGVLLFVQRSWAEAVIQNGAQEVTSYFLLCSGSDPLSSAVPYENQQLLG